MKEEMTIKQYSLMGLSLALGFIVLLFTLSALMAKFDVWRSGLAGEAQLKKAEWNRQIAIREAEAKRQAAMALAQAEIERAKGVAQANKIIGESLNNNEAYLRYLWIQNLEGRSKEVIYRPTEANLPVLEASRLKK